MGMAPVISLDLLVDSLYCAWHAACGNLELCRSANEIDTARESGRIVSLFYGTFGAPKE